MIWYSMHQILEYEVTRNIIIGILLCVCISSCCFCLCKVRRRELKKKVRISPRETVYVNPLRIKDEKILRIIWKIEVRIWYQYSLIFSKTRMTRMGRSQDGPGCLLIVGLPFILIFAIVETIRDKCDDRKTRQAKRRKRRRELKEEQKKTAVS